MPLSGWLDALIPEAIILDALAKFILEEIDLCSTDEFLPNWCYGEGIRLFVSIGGENAILDFFGNLVSMPDAPQLEEVYWFQFSRFGDKSVVEALKKRLE